MQRDGYMVAVGARSAGVAMAQLAAGLQLRHRAISAGTAAAQVILCAVDAGCFFPDHKFLLDIVLWQNAL